MMQFAGLRPRDKKECLKPPNHRIGVDSIEAAITDICIFQKILTKEQQKAEKWKHTGLSKRMKSLLRRKVRPAPLDSAPSDALQQPLSLCPPPTIVCRSAATMQPSSSSYRCPQT